MNVQRYVRGLVHEHLDPSKNFTRQKKDAVTVVVTEVSFLTPYIMTNSQKHNGVGKQEVCVSQWLREMLARSRFHSYRAQIYVFPISCPEK